jgi:hypothetical protein
MVISSFNAVKPPEGQGKSMASRIFGIVVSCLIILFQQFISSDCFSILRIQGMLLYGGDEMIQTRGLAASQGRQGDENYWGFGQILPILLLAIPFLNSWKSS